MELYAGRGLAANTINDRIRACQQFFKFLFVEGIIDCNLAIGLKPIPATKTMLHTFSEQQLQAILHQPDQSTFAGQRDYTIMLVFLDTGMRVGELTALKTSDINQDEGYFLIHSAKNRKARQIPFQNKCGKALHNYLLHRGSHPTDDLWITIFHKPLTRYGLIDMVSRYCKKAGIQGVKGSSHTFRHTMAKMFLLNGGDVDTLQYILGHSSLEMRCLDMVKLYVNLFRNDIQEKHRKYSPVEHIQV